MATHLGNVKTWFNQLAYTSSELPIPEGSLVAPVVDAINYPVLGAPLPLIQAGDFAGLISINSILHIPQELSGKVGSSIFYNDQEEAVFLSTPVGAPLLRFLLPAMISVARRLSLVGEENFYMQAGKWILKVISTVRIRMMRNTVWMDGYPIDYCIKRRENLAKGKPTDLPQFVTNG